MSWFVLDVNNQMSWFVLNENNQVSWFVLDENNCVSWFVLDGNLCQFQSDTLSFQNWYSYQSLSLRKISYGLYAGTIILNFNMVSHEKRCCRCSLHLALCLLMLPSGACTLFSLFTVSLSSFHFSECPLWQSVSSNWNLQGPLPSVGICCLSMKMISTSLYPSIS